MSAERQIYRLKGPFYRLEGEECNRGHMIFPPRDVCPDCAKERMEEHFADHGGNGRATKEDVEMTIPVAVAFEEIQQS